MLDTREVTGVHVDGRCVRHQFEEAEGMCRHCGDWFCGECLVYSFGPKKPPYCVGCALAASGVRSNAAGQVKVSRREMKRREKAAAKAMKAAKERESAPAPSMAIDWSSDDVGWDESRAVS